MAAKIQGVQKASRIQAARRDHSQMRRVLKISTQSGLHLVESAGRCVVVLCCLSLCASGQARAGGEVSGHIRDSSGRPVPGVVVTLKKSAGEQSLGTQTDVQGSYRFVGVSQGTYKVQASAKGYAAKTSEDFDVEANRTQTQDLVLPSSSAGTANVPEFYDEPQFTVAGVTDTTNLGTHGADTVVRNTESLVRETASLGKVGGSESAPAPTGDRESSLRETLRKEPQSVQANHELGTVLLASGRAREAIPYLEKAHQLSPPDDQEIFELATACFAIGEYEHARSNLQVVLNHQETADARHLLADVDEKLGHSVDAVREYGRAAELDPSESNLFDWGSELLLHRAYEPAGEVFGKGKRLFPKSSRMRIGLGVSLYARGSYDEAVRRFCEASDLEPQSVTPYIFMGKIQSADHGQSDDVTAKLGRFVQLKPESVDANFYYAMSLWKARSGPEDTAHLPQIEALLDKAVRLDPTLGPGFLLLGILFEAEGKLPAAISAYQKAVAVSPQLEQAHYRLAQAYRKNGEEEKAKAEIQLYETTSKQSVEKAEREQREIQGFVYTLRNQTFGAPVSQKPPAPQ
jgi:tetratricopeptide (TPR) repeat protein